MRNDGTSRIAVGRRPKANKAAPTRHDLGSEKRPL
jgi:hypothetical protein